MKKPNFFIVGEPKSGTTAIYYFLRQHPDVFMSVPKEPFYFCKDIHEKAKQFGNAHYIKYKKEEEYMNLFKEVKNEKVVGEGSVVYLFSELAAKEIYSFNPDAKILAVFREPISFLKSYHNHMILQGNETQRDFEKALKLEKIRKKGKKVPKTTLCPEIIFYFEWVKYAEHLKRFLDIFPKEQVKIVIYENFKEDNISVFKEILKFLNIETFEPKIKKINVRKSPKSYLMTRYFAYIQKLRKYITPPKILSLLSKKIYNWNWTSAKKKALDEKLANELQEKFYSEVKKLDEILSDHEFIKKGKLMKLWRYEGINEKSKKRS